MKIYNVIKTRLCFVLSGVTLTWSLLFELYNPNKVTIPLYAYIVVGCMGVMALTNVVLFFYYSNKKENE
jgi:hypothetical protein